MVMGNQQHYSLEYVKAVARGAIDSLSLLHQAGIVHGYVSPSSLLVSTPGEPAASYYQCYV